MLDTTCLTVMVNGSAAVTSLLLVQLTALSIPALPLPLASVCAELSDALFNSSVNGERGCTHTQSPGALICLNDCPAPLRGSYQGRHDAILCAPPAVPSTMRGH